ncbi:MAG: hypothetical protein ACYTHK_08490 [Planctomycetota bacterium]
MFLLVVLLASERTESWNERIRNDPQEAGRLLQTRDAAALETVVGEALAAKDTKVLDALGWQAVAALPADSKIVARLEEYVLTDGIRAKAYVPEGYELVLGPQAAAEPAQVSLEWENGSGHGFTYRRYRAHWSDDGLRVRRMRYFRNVRTDKKQGTVLESTVIPRRRAEVVLRTVLAATGLELRKLQGLHGASGSSSDFHVLLRIESDRTVYSKRFTGYHGSTKAPRYVALRVCNSLLREALRDCEWKVEKPSDADLADLAKRLQTLRAEYWWVRERLILMAGMVGDKRCLPALEAQIRQPVGIVARAHRYAIDGYAKISGVDLRPKEWATANVRTTRAKYIEHFDRR